MLFIYLPTYLHHLGHTLFFSHYNIGLAGLFIGIGEILGKYTHM